MPFGGIQRRICVVYPQTSVSDNVEWVCLLIRKNTHFTALSQYFWFFHMQLTHLCSIHSSLAVFLLCFYNNFLIFKCVVVSQTWFFDQISCKVSRSLFSYCDSMTPAEGLVYFLMFLLHQALENWPLFTDLCLTFLETQWTCLEKVTQATLKLQTNFI